MLCHNILQCYVNVRRHREAAARRRARRHRAAAGGREGVDAAKYCGLLFQS